MGTGLSLKIGGELELVKNRLRFSVNTHIKEEIIIRRKISWIHGWKNKVALVITWI